MIHPKSGLISLAGLLIERGIRRLVVSPGSRNAPVVSALSQLPEFECFTIVDERSAGFFALGLAQQSGEPVALSCTSGSAVLNYGPAVAEAYYQRIPLLLLTADRPPEWIDQADGQTIRQHGVFNLHVRKSISLPAEISTDDELWFAGRLCSEALNALSWPVAGPVHINLPFREPLYNLPEGEPVAVKDIRVINGSFRPSVSEMGWIVDQWNTSRRKMIIVGQMTPDPVVHDALKQLSNDPSVVVLTETTSNMPAPNFVGTIDRSLAVMSEADDYQPDILLTLGGQVVSKRIKTFLRKVNHLQHWHVDTAELHPDTYQHLRLMIPARPADFLPLLAASFRPMESSFAQLWQKLHRVGAVLHQRYLQACSFADLKVFELIFNHLPAGYDIQLSNSTPVRYAQLFDNHKGWLQFANRGTSGIDGCVSTAVGAAYASGRPTLLITGDLAFFYDSNGLWHNHLPSNLKIIVIHNGGGGIFRFIDGPSDSGLLERFFEASHRTSAEGIASTFGLNYAYSNTEQSLVDALSAILLPSSGASVLEVSTPAAKSASMLKCYFKYLADNKLNVSL
jgi:2-succinyl-5-enolpyruvyl-6-hydroxy-3-cyclohexene-1-carboxylate synthase